MSRRIAVRIDTDSMRLTGMMTYRVTKADGAERLVECPFGGPLLHPEEYGPLLEAAGFTAEREDAGRFLRFVARPA